MIVALIPARSGSKRVKDKNIRPLGGYPLMAWSIACAKICGLETYVSSESIKYLGIAEKYGALAHLRTSGYSDSAKDIAVISEFIECVSCHDIVYLRPTTPLRDSTFIRLALQAYSNHRVHYISLCKMRDGDFYRNTGYCEIFPFNAFGKDETGIIQDYEVGEIDTEEDFDYIEWRLTKYGSPILDYLKANYPNPE